MSIGRLLDRVDAAPFDPDGDRSVFASRTVAKSSMILLHVAMSRRLDRRSGARHVLTGGAGYDTSAGVGARSPGRDRADRPSLARERGAAVRRGAGSPSQEGCSGPSRPRVGEVEVMLPGLAVVADLPAAGDLLPLALKVPVKRWVKSSGEKSGSSRHRFQTPSSKLIL
jgi:hypothetical protein